LRLHGAGGILSDPLDQDPAPLAIGDVPAAEVRALIRDDLGALAALP
jgi:hypothetical protein